MSTPSQEYSQAPPFTAPATKNMKNDHSNGQVSNDDPNLSWSRVMANQVYAQQLPVPDNDTTGQVVRIVCMSDTHGLHRQVILPTKEEMDVLIHGGDFTKMGEVEAIRDLSLYFRQSGMEKERIVCIAGNHDMTLHDKYYETAWPRFHDKKLDCAEARNSLQYCTYLEDETLKIAVGGAADVDKESHDHFVECYGSPWSPEFFDWAFNMKRDEIHSVWDAIPSSTDLLITHGPPMGRGDETSQHVRAGCYDLLRQVQERIKPRLHIFGHIHEGYGTTFDGTTLYVNASNLNMHYQCVNLPVVVDLPLDTTISARVVKPTLCTIENVADFVSWLEQKSDSYRNLLQAISLADPEKTKLLELADGGMFVGSSIFNAMAKCFKIGSPRHPANQELRTAIGQLYIESLPPKQT